MSEDSHDTAVTRTSKNSLEASTGQKTQYYVGVVKDKRTGKNGLEFLIGWCQVRWVEIDNAGRVGLAPRSSHLQKQDTFPDIFHYFAKQKSLLLSSSPSVS